MELTNRDELEAEFALKVSRLSAKKRKQLEKLLGNPPDINNVPPEFWNETEDDYKELLLLLLLLIATQSYVQHGGELIPAYSLPRFDQAIEKLAGISTDKPSAPSPVVRWASDQSGVAASGIVKHSKDILARAGQRWAEEHDEIDDILEVTLEIFGPKRAERIAINETTRAQHFGSEYAISTTVGLSPEDKWINRPDMSKAGPCPVCEPLHHTPRSYWSKFYPEGPPQPHMGCVCFIEYANQPKEVSA